MADRLKEIEERCKKATDWFDDQSEKRMGQAISRRAHIDRNATRAELKQAMKLAEKMNGGKLRGVSGSVDIAYCDMQERIAVKLESESRELSGFAEAIRGLLEQLAAAQRALQFAKLVLPSKSATIAVPQQLIDVIDEAIRERMKEE